jgi:hypothetical protein
MRDFAFVLFLGDWLSTLLFLLLYSSLSKMKKKKYLMCVYIHRFGCIYTWWRWAGGWLRRCALLSLSWLSLSVCLISLKHTVQHAYVHYIATNKYMVVNTKRKKEKKSRLLLYLILTLYGKKKKNADSVLWDRMKLYVEWSRFRAVFWTIVHVFIVSSLKLSSQKVFSSTFYYKALCSIHCEWVSNENGRKQSHKWKDFLFA